MNILSTVKNGIKLAKAEGIIDEIKQSVYSFDYLHGLIKCNSIDTNGHMTPDEESSNDILLLAYDENNSLKRKNLAYQAFKLNRYNHRALKLIINDVANLENKLWLKKKILQDATYYLNEKRYFDSEYEGRFWELVETRSYMMIKQSYILLLARLNYLHEAIKEAYECLYLCREDNLGIRFLYMNLLCLTNQYKLVITTFERYHEYSPFMIIPLSVAYYHLGQSQQAKNYLDMMIKKNQNFAPIIFDHQALSFETRRYMNNTNKYLVNSLHEMYLAVSEHSNIIFTDLQYFKWLKQNYYKLTP